MTSLKVMNHIANLSYFVSTFVKKKELTTIILELQIAQALHPPKSKVQIIFYVNHLNLAPHMAIMFLIHSLHLPIMTIGTNNMGEFKQDITTKSTQNAMNILNAKVVII
jgi:hypothetical protein